MGSWLLVVKLLVIQVPCDRDGVVIFDGKLASLKHFKDDVKEVGNAQEGGLMIENYNDIKVDDVIEAYIMEEIKR